MSDILEKFNIFSEIDEEFKLNIHLFHVFDDEKGKSVLFVTNEDRVYGFGSNFSGMCGLGHNERVVTPKEIPELSGKQIKQFFIGMNFVLGLNQMSELFGWGQNDSGQLARGSVNQFNEYCKPGPIDLNGMIEISCGSMHSLAVNSDGVVYSWGDNYRGQVGTGKQSGEHICSPVQLKSLPKIKSIHCFVNYSFAVTFDGLVYSWGQNGQNCLGHELKDRTIFQPRLINGLANILSVRSNWHNTYFLSTDGNVYFCGKNMANDYFRNSHEYQSKPKLFETPTPMKFTSMIKIHSDILAISDDIVYNFQINSLKKTKYKTFLDYCSHEKQSCFGTIEREFIRLGSGDVGTVFKWLDKRELRLYALKVVKIAEQVVDRLNHEVSLLLKCSDVFVVKYFNSWLQDNSYYIKMELCATNLARVIDEKGKIFGRFPTNAMTLTEFYISSQLLKELLEAVEYLHDLRPNPIIHRNLKPQNILFCAEQKNGRFLKLGDFSWATDSGTAKTCGHTLMAGTPKYMAPEVFGEKNTKGDYNTKCDIYSMGIVVCDLFKYDFNDLNEEIKNNSDLKEYWKHLETLIDDMINFRYHRRPSCTEILARSPNWLLNQIGDTRDLELIATQPKSFLFSYLSFKLGDLLANTIKNRKSFDDCFDKLDDLASGGYGKVVKVRNKATQQMYAIKVIEMKINETHTLFEYQKEVKLISKCNEEYVVKYIDSWIENNRFYIQLELCSDNLKNIIKLKADCFGRKDAEPLSTTEFFISSQMFKEILDSIHYLHTFDAENCIIHRDLKPANILVNFQPKNGRFLKLGDFGLATFYNSRTISQRKYVGTAKYMAPEILNATHLKPRYSPKSDIYSLGKILCELFDYDMNFDEQNMDNPDVKDKWPQIEDLVDRMLTTKYNRRPNCAEILENYNFWRIDKALVDLNLVSMYSNRFFYDYTVHYLNAN